MNVYRASPLVPAGEEKLLILPLWARLRRRPWRTFSNPPTRISLVVFAGETISPLVFKELNASALASVAQSGRGPQLKPTWFFDSSPWGEIHYETEEFFIGFESCAARIKGYKRKIRCWCSLSVQLRWMDFVKDETALTYIRPLRQSTVLLAMN